MKSILSIIFLSMFFFSTLAQTDTVIKKENLSAEDLQKIIKTSNIDSIAFLRESSNMACKCIDSISLKNKSNEQIVNEICSCIDKQVSGYQLAVKLYHSMTDLTKNKTISINVNKNSAEYQQYYFQIERWLQDSCKSMKDAVKSNNKESEFSFSKNDEAVALYNKGTTAMQNENIKEALSYFEDAVKKDSKFAFAWDNIGICNRKLNNFDAALNAYKKSLEIDPTGKTPLQNIAIVYEFEKNYDKALEAYLNISNYYPGDAEAYYGAGRIYTLKSDFENGLQNMCKAYNIYTNTKSPYRVDAEKQINYLYSKMKGEGKEELFNKILKDNNISTSTK